jgi:sugar phosphate isomerase/epimerase
MHTVRYCLNTSTIRGQGLSLAEEARIAAGAGYQAIEPWIAEIETFVAQGGRLADLKTQIADLGLTVECVISFSEWVNEAAETPGGLDPWKRDLDLAARIGGKRIAAPPTGAIHHAEKDLVRVAARYRRLLELGRSFGVTPLVELWGRSRWGLSQTLSRVGEVAATLIECGDSGGGALLDVFHLHTGGSPVEGLRYFHPDALPVFHFCDYPADPPRETITSPDRVYPGDGVAPLGQVLRELQAIGFSGFLSLELFNPTYWQQDAREVARTGLEKMRAVVERELGR